MSLFPRSFTQELSPLFRMMDDYASLTRDFPTAGPLKSMRSFQPKFDVSETKDAYQLHGELPGIEQKNVSIEWADSNTLTISGRTETHTESGDVQQQGQITGESSQERSSVTPEMASVEDEAGEQPTSSAAAASTTTAVAKAAPQQQEQELARQSAQPKYWISERSAGEFHRSFSFPARVDQDGVKASLKNGVLSVLVPKAAKPVARKIAIE